MSSAAVAMDKVITSGRGPAGNDERMIVSSKWRMGQYFVAALILILAVYYFTAGWRSVAGETGGADSRSPFDAAGFAILLGFTFLCTPTAGVIAMTTFQEALRRRWMTALLAFGLVLLALSTFFTWMQPGEEEKFLRDFGTGFIIIMTLLMSIFLGVALVPPDIERRTIFTILSKPVNRLEFLLGKYFGLCLTLLVNLVLMGGLFLISYAMFKIRRDPSGLAGAMAIADAHPGLIFDLSNLIKAFILQFGMLAILSALALTLSLIVSNITAIVFSFLAYFGGQMSSYWEHLVGGGADDVHEAAHLSKPLAGVVNVVYYMLPRLDRFDVRERLVNEIGIGFNYMWKAMGTGLVYVAVLLTIAYLVFSDREF